MSATTFRILTLMICFGLAQMNENECVAAILATYDYPNSGVPGQGPLDDNPSWEEDVFRSIA
jgi:hypothetical protein